MRKGANFNDLGDLQKLPLLEYAASNSHWDIIKFFIKSDDKNKYFNHLNNQQKVKLLDYYIQANDGDIVNFFMENVQVTKGNSLLHWAAREGKLDVVKYLVKMGVDINARNSDSQTPLDVAAQNGHNNIVVFLEQEVQQLNQHLLVAARDADLDTIKEYIGRGANLNARDISEYTPLHLAVQNGHLDTIKYLVEKEANLNARDISGCTPLHLAVQNGHLDTIKYLVEKNADVNAADNNGMTPFHLLAQLALGKVASPIERGVIANAGRSSKSSLSFQGFIQRMSSLFSRGETLPYMKKSAIADRDSNIFFSLDKNPSLVKGADISAKDNRNNIPLHLATSNDLKDLVELFLEKGANVDAKDKSNRTPLYLALSKGKWSMSKLLLERGADSKDIMNIEDNDREDFLKWAEDNNYKVIVERFIYQAEESAGNTNSGNQGGKTPNDLNSILSQTRQHPRQQGSIDERTLGKILSKDGSEFKIFAKATFEKRQKTFLRLGKYVDIHFSEAGVKALKQGLYLPSFESRNVKIDGRCAAITRMFSQGLFLGQQVHESLLANLQTSAELYERIAQGKQISKREEKGIFVLSRFVNGIEEELISLTSSLPSSLSHIKSYKTLDDLSHYVGGLTDDFAIHLVTSNHVVAIYRTGDTYTYFDSNVALVSNLNTVDQLMKVVKKGVEYAGYELAEEGFLVEHFDVAQANNALTLQRKEVLTKPIQTERHLLSLQDQEHGLIDVDGEQVSRVTLYDMGAKLHVEGSAPVLINSEMTREDLVQNLSSGKIKITAREYLQKLKGSSKEIIQDIVQTTSPLPLDGSINEVKDAKTIQDLVLSENGQRLNSYELNKILKGPIEQSIKALPYYLEVANTKHWPNRLTNAAGRISMAKGLYDVAHSIRYGDTEGFLLLTITHKYKWT